MATNQSTKSAWIYIRRLAGLAFFVSMCLLFDSILRDIYDGKFSEMYRKNGKEKMQDYLSKTWLSEQSTATHTQMLPRFVENKSTPINEVYTSGVPNIRANGGSTNTSRGEVTFSDFYRGIKNLTNISEMYNYATEIRGRASQSFKQFLDRIHGRIDFESLLQSFQILRWKKVLFGRFLNHSQSTQIYSRDMSSKNLSGTTNIDGEDPNITTLNSKADRNPPIPIPKEKKTMPAFRAENNKNWSNFRAIATQSLQNKTSSSPDSRDHAKDSDRDATLWRETDSNGDRVSGDLKEGNDLNHRTNWSQTDASFLTIPPSIKSRAVDNLRRAVSELASGRYMRERTADSKIPQPGAKSSGVYNSWREFSGTSEQYRTRRVALETASIEIWAHSDMRQSEESYKPFCRLFEVCQTRAGTLVLPVALRKYEQVLATCGLGPRSVEFRDLRNMSQGKYRPITKFKGIQLDQLDLVEAKAPRRGSHHFLADSLKVLFFIDSIYGSGPSPYSALKRSCMSRHDSWSGPCTRETESDIRPAIYVQKKSFLDDQWVPNFLRLLASPHTVKSNNRFIYLNQQSIFAKNNAAEPEPAVCYHSLTTSAHRYGEIPSSSLKDDNPFFSGNGISRGRPRLPHVRTKQQQRCTIRVKLSEYMTQANHMAISLLGNLTRIKQVSAAIKPSMTILWTSERNGTFSDQIRRIQKADIFVSPHGPSMSDIIFLRESSAVIEIQPFALNSRMFSGMARQLSLRYSALSAEPDTKTFTECIAHLNEKGNKSSSRAVVEMFLNATDEYKAKGETNLRLGADDLNISTVVGVKMCARRQSLRLDPLKLAAEIWYHAQAICQG